jgi:hypothetical protein
MKSFFSSASLIKCRRLFSFALLTATILIPAFAAAKTTWGRKAKQPLVLIAGPANGRHAELIFSPQKTSASALVVKTVEAGVTGSKLAISVSGRREPVFEQIFADGQCRFGESGGSRCEIVIPGESAAYKSIVAAFKRAQSGQLTVENAGVMAMSESLPLTGFTREYRTR